MDRQLVRGDRLLRTGGLGQTLDEPRALVDGDHPADDVPTEQIESHVELA